MKGKILPLLLALLLLTGCLAGARAERALSSAEALAAFRTFGANAAGRYAVQMDDDLVVVELIPAFGRLFASVAYYMEGSLYSFLAAELTPDDLTQAANRAGNSETSFTLNVRSHSIMSNAGQYWPGEAKQRFTLTGDGLLLSGFAGDGSALVSAEDTALLRAEDVPGVLVYGPADAAMAYDVGARVDAPEAMTGAWSATWRADGVDRVVRMELAADGMMTVLLTAFDGRPARLLRGGYALLPAADNTYALHYLLSAVDSGTMPFEGSARLAPDGNGLAVSAFELSEGWTDECLLLPDEETTVVYERGENPMRLVWMTLVDERDGQSFFDVTARDPFDGGEELLTVLKDGGTLFGWSSDRKSLDMFALWAKIKTGKPIPVLCHCSPWSTVDMLLVLDDIAEDTELLMVRTPYFAALRDYREVADGRLGSEASVYFDAAGEPMLHLENRTDYEVQRELTARIVRRVGSVFTASDEAGDSVTFEIQPYGWLVILDQNLSFATHGFPGFGERFYQKTE